MGVGAPIALDKHFAVAIMAAMRGLYLVGKKKPFGH